MADPFKGLWKAPLEFPLLHVQGHMLSQKERIKVSKWILAPKVTKKINNIGMI